MATIIYCLAKVLWTGQTKNCILSVGMCVQTRYNKIFTSVNNFHPTPSNSTHRVFNNINKRDILNNPKCCRLKSRYRTCISIEGIFNATDHTSSLENLHLGSNPLVCDEYLCWVYVDHEDWLRVADAGDVTCAGPAGLAGRGWSTLTVQDLHCG